MGDITVLEGVLAKDTALLRAARPEQLGAPTPCSEYDVQALMNHMVGSIQFFAAGANERTSNGDFTAVTSDDPGTDFHAAAADMINGWRTGGVERTIRLAIGELPAQLVLDMAIMEFVTHGCDLAKATGQPVPFSEAELTLTLQRAHATLPEHFRGEGKAFGHLVEVSPDAPAVDRLLAFMGRQP